MSGIVIEIYQRSVRLREAPFCVKQVERSVPFRIRNPADVSLEHDPSIPGSVRKCGQRLCTQLTRNESIKDVIQLLGRADGRIPVYVEADEPEYENLPWEAIWSKDLDFLSLGKTAPIARIPASRDSRESFRSAGGKLKVLVVLGVKDPAVERYQAPEWRALWRTLEPFAHRVQLRVLVCSDEMKDLVESIPGIECALIDPVAHYLEQTANIFQPNLVHFFCHGSSGPDAALTLGTYGPDKVRVDAQILRTIAKNQSVWMMVLNSCDGAAANRSGTNSLARQIACTGVPAVIAMRRTIHPSDANVFTRALYGSLVRPFIDAIPGPGTTSRFPEDALHLAMLAARQELKDEQRGTPAVARRAEDCLEWTLPALYLHRGVQLRGDRGERESTTLDEAASRAVLQALGPASGHEGEPFLARLRDEIAALLRDAQKA